MLAASAAAFALPLPLSLSGVMDVDDIQRYVVAGNKSKLVYLHPRCG
jgi:hypothetical protein